MKWLINIFLCIYPIFGYSQTKGDVELKTFFSVPTNTSVELKWTISAGFTCNGTEILWSEDSVNFERIGGIAGFCGSVSSNTSYSFTHKNPASNKRNYYKLELGTNGDSQTVSTFYVDLAAETYLTIPNPARDNTTIYFRNNSNSNISFSLYNTSGIKILDLNNIYDSEINLETQNLPNGLYYFLIQAEDSKALKGKILIQH